MGRKGYSEAAFGYVDGDVRLLLHHDPARVKSGKEHDTVDPLLLMLSMELVDVIPVSNEVREEIRMHLNMHASVILYSAPDVAGLPIALTDKMRDYAFFKANLAGTAESPPITTNARGVLYVMYDKVTHEMSYFCHYADLSGPETAAHFHIGKGGKVGDIIIPATAGNPKTGSIVLTEEQCKALFEGNVYFNVHSSNFPIGEIRGQVVPAAVSRSNNEQIVAPGTPPMDKNPGPGKVIVPPKEADPKAQVYEATQTEPNSAGRTDGGPDVAKAPSEAKPKVDVHQFHAPVYSEETLPAGTAVRPGIQLAEKVPGEDVHDDSEMRPPIEGKPSPDIEQLNKQGEHGAVYNNMSEDDKKKKKKKKEKEETGHWGGYANRVDYARPLVNIVVEPDQQPVADGTAKKIMDAGTASGADVPPKVSVSKLSDPDNAAIKAAIDEFRKAESEGRPGPGSIKLRDRVISLLSDRKFNGRIVIFPVTGSEDAEVMMIEAAKWSTAFINNLPDSSFAVIERGGKKEDGKTVPRGYRHLPYKDASGKIDLPHLRNALARMNQLKAVSSKDSTDRIRRVARGALVRVAREHLPGTKFAKSNQFSFKDMLGEVDVEVCRSIIAGEIPVTAQLMEVRAPPMPTPPLR